MPGWASPVGRPCLPTPLPPSQSPLPGQPPPAGLGPGDMRAPQIAGGQVVSGTDCRGASGRRRAPTGACRPPGCCGTWPSPWTSWTAACCGAPPLRETLKETASSCARSLPVQGHIFRPVGFSCDWCALRANVAVPVSLGKPAGCRWYIIAVTEQFVHRRVADERYINAVQELEALVGAPPPSPPSPIVWPESSWCRDCVKKDFAWVNDFEKLKLLLLPNRPL